MMGALKAIGKGAKRLPWRKILKYGGAAVGLPVIATQSGANAEIVGVTSSGITEHVLILIQALLGLLSAIVQERRQAATKQAAE